MPFGKDKSVDKKKKADKIAKDAFKPNAKFGKAKDQIKSLGC